MDQGRFPHITDEELVLSTLIGNLEAFDELIRRFRRAITFIAEQTLGSRETAEDVVQETFLLAFKALPQLKEPGKFSSWLCAIARHRACRVAAQSARTQPTEPGVLDRLLLTQSEELASTAMEQWLSKSERVLISVLLAQLPPENREVLYLHYFEEWPVARIAVFLSLSITTVQWRLHHGRKLLRNQFARQKEEQSHERKRSVQPGNSAHMSTVATDDRRSQGDEHDRQPGEGLSPGRTAV